MILKRFENAEEFYPLVESFLMENEAEHNLILGFRTVLKHTPERYPNPYLAFVQDDVNILAVVAMTPPHHVILSHVKALEALQLVVHDLYEQYKTLPGVQGSPSASKYFVEQWQAISGQTFRLEFAQRIYQLDAINPVTGVPGKLRRAADTDYALLVDWALAFEQEALGSGNRADSEATITRLLHSEISGLYVWEVAGQVVSMANYGGLTPNGARIGLVYTPPDQRKKGYASACVAALCQFVLDTGRKFCFLYTDLANPTSNHIYQQIGFNPICDVDRLRFEPR